MLVLRIMSLSERAMISSVNNAEGEEIKVGLIVGHRTLISK